MDTTFEDSVSLGYGYEGGAISSKNHSGNIDIENSIFRNNENKIFNTEVVGGGGGAIAFHYFTGKLNIKDSIFEYNTTNGSGVDVKSTYDGGAIMVQGTGNPGFTTTIKNTSFYDNKAYGLSGGNRSGGAIQFFKNGGSSSMDNNVINSSFINNQAGHEDGSVDQRGGAIGLSGAGFLATASINLEGSLFVGNKVYSRGQLNETSSYKDISNNTRMDLGKKNVINIGSEFKPEDILGVGSQAVRENHSNIRAGFSGELVKTIPILPESIANNTNDRSGDYDQRGYARNRTMVPYKLVGLNMMPIVGNLSLKT